MCQQRQQGSDGEESGTEHDEKGQFTFWEYRYDVMKRQQIAIGTLRVSRIGKKEKTFFKGVLNSLINTQSYKMNKSSPEYIEKCPPTSNGAHSMHRLFASNASND